MEGIAVDQITRSRRGKLYIDTTAWGPEADSIKLGYWIPSDLCTYSSAGSMDLSQNQISTS